MSTKTVRDIMTPISNVYMIPFNSLLDFETTTDIITHGYTRIPVYDGDRTNICFVLNVKDLAFVDPNDRVPVATVCKFYNRTVIKTDGGTYLCDILKTFRKGNAILIVISTFKV